MKLKLQKYPKKPKASASVASKENYLKRVSDIDAANRSRIAENKKSEALSKRIAGLGSATSILSRRSKVSSTPRKKRSGGKKRKK